MIVSELSWEGTAQAVFAGEPTRLQTPVSEFDVMHVNQHRVFRAGEKCRQMPCRQRRQIVGIQRARFKNRDPFEAYLTGD